MTESERDQEISRLKGEITEAENNICQLTALNTACNDYQMELESVRNMRKRKLEYFNYIQGQVRLVGAYGEAMRELLCGIDYTKAYIGMDDAKAKIGREIERQNQIISECNSQIAGLNSMVIEAENGVYR